MVVRTDPPQSCWNVCHALDKRHCNVKAMKDPKVHATMHPSETRYALRLLPLAVRLYRKRKTLSFDLRKSVYCHMFDIADCNAVLTDMPRTSIDSRLAAYVICKCQRERVRLATVFHQRFEPLLAARRSESPIASLSLVCRLQVSIPTEQKI